MGCFVCKNVLIIAAAMWLQLVSQLPSRLGMNSSLSLLSIAASHVPPCTVPYFTPTSTMAEDEVKKAQKGFFQLAKQWGGMCIFSSNILPMYQPGNTSNLMPQIPPSPQHSSQPSSSHSTPALSAQSPCSSRQFCSSLPTSTSPATPKTLPAHLLPGLRCICCWLADGSIRSRSGLGLEA